MPEKELLLPYDRFVAPFTSDRGQAGDLRNILGNTQDHYDEHTPWVLAIAAAR